MFQKALLSTVYASLLFSFFILSSCSSKYELEGFDSELWKAEHSGCRSHRLELAKVLLKHKNELIGLPSRDNLALLGRPNQKSLGRKMNKVYIYIISPDESCSKNSSTRKKALHVELEALGRIKLMMIK